MDQNNRWNAIKSELFQTLQVRDAEGKQKFITPQAEFEGGLIKSLEAKISRPGEEFEDDDVADFCEQYEDLMDNEVPSIRRVKAAQDIIAILVQRNIIQERKQSAAFKRLLEQYRIHTKM